MSNARARHRRELEAVAREALDLRAGTGYTEGRSGQAGPPLLCFTRGGVTLSAHPPMFGLFSVSTFGSGRQTVLPYVPPLR